MTDEQLIGEIEHIRAKNNTHWMDLVRLAFKLAPEEAREIMEQIRQCDASITKLTEQLSKGGQ